MVFEHTALQLLSWRRYALILKYVHVDMISLYVAAFYICMWMAMICNGTTSYYFPGFCPSSHHMQYEKTVRAREWG